MNLQNAGATCYPGWRVCAWAQRGFFVEANPYRDGEIIAMVLPFEVRFLPLMSLL